MLKNDTENILVDNYNTLEYSRYMLISLEDSTEEGIKTFESSLRNQELNITESGEKEITALLRFEYEKYKKDRVNSYSQKQIRKAIFKLMAINMKAIQNKSMVAKKSATNAVFAIVFTGILCLTIALLLLIKLPSNIANPIKELNQSIKQIASKKYTERVHFESHNEFGELAQSFNTMAEKLEEYNNSNLAKLMNEKKRIETLINNMHDPLVGLDENLNILFANEEAIKIIGKSEQEIIGKNAQELAIKNDLIRLLIQEDLNKTINNSQIKPKPIKIFANNKEGYFEKETLNISIVPTGEHTNQIIGHVIILRNVTEYKELDVAKTNFIATVSHELKTPISSIKMSVQLLENEKIGTTNDEQKNLIDSIKDDATRLLKITSELLNMTQVESGNIQLGIIPTDPFEILNYAVNTNKMIAEQKHIKLEIDCPKNLPKVLADSEKTAWVLTNLISNAIRYSYDNSSILIAVNQHLSTINFIVKDTGQGIEPKYKDKIFDRYFRIPGSNKEGTGLGLSISKEFIEAQGGHIKVESDFGAGSTFTVTLNAQS